MTKRVALLGKPLRRRHSVVMHNAAFAAAGIDAQCVLGGSRVDLLRRHGIRDGIVPPERETVVVVAIVGITLPGTGQPDGVRRVLETAVAEQLGRQPASDAPGASTGTAYDRKSGIRSARSK